MKPKIIVKAGVPKGYMEPEEPKLAENFGADYEAWAQYERAKAAAIAEAKEFEEEMINGSSDWGRGFDEGLKKAIEKLDTVLPNNPE